MLWGTTERSGNATERRFHRRRVQPRKRDGRFKSRRRSLLRTTAAIALQDSVITNSLPVRASLRRAAAEGGVTLPRPRQ